MPLTADDIVRAFDALAEELSRRNERAQIAIAGGAAMVLLFDARESTEDVDAYIVSPTAAVVRESMEGTRRQIWEMVCRYVAAHDLQKASYAFDDLWEALYGSP